MADASDVRHLLSRAGFGASDAEIATFAALPSIPAVVDQILADPRLVGAPVYKPQAPASARPSCNNDVAYFQTLELGRWFLNRMAESRYVSKKPTVPHPLREKMTLFWHGLLVSSLEKDSLYCNHFTLRTQHLMFRAHALADYETLLAETSKDPAMLLYLDNWISTAENPNENYARELLELFSLGVGHYSQAEVIAVARAGTGYSLAETRNGEHVTRYTLKSDEHDRGADKTFFGITANWDLVGESGDADARSVVEYLTSSAGQGGQLASALARLLWEYFASFAPPSTLIDQIAPAFVASGKVEIRDGLRAIFTHPDFYGDAARRGKLKNPVEWSVMVLRALGVKAPFFRKDRYDPLQQGGMDEMGLQLFFQPSVFGWWRRPETRWLGLSAFHAKLGVVAALSELVLKKRSRLLALSELESPELVDRLFGLFGAPPAAGSSTRAEGIFLRESLRAQGIDSATQLSTLLRYVALTPPALSN